MSRDLSEGAQNRPALTGWTKMGRGQITQPSAGHHCGTTFFRGTIPTGGLMSDVWQFREQVPHDGQRWGQWRFDEQSGALEYEDGNTRVRIDLSAIDGSARVLDWIFWLSGHDWYTRHDLADLIQAFDEIFYPRANLCPNGCDQHMDGREYLHVMSGMGKLERKAA